MTENGWIVSEAFKPEKFKEVLITFKKGEKAGVTSGFWNGEKWFFDYMTSEGKMPEVIAWQPMPEPWEGN